MKTKEQIEREINISKSCLPTTDFIIGRINALEWVMEDDLSEEELLEENNMLKKELTALRHQFLPFIYP